MTASWEFAVSEARGEFVTVLGDDDGLMLHALPELDRIVGMLDARVLRWEPARYYWPDVPPQPFATANEVLVPLLQRDHFHAIRVVDSRLSISDAVNARISYAALPMVYCAVVHRSLLAELRQRTGSVFGSSYPDVYSAFSIAYVAGRYHTVEAPMTINALSGGSVGLGILYLHGHSDTATEFRQHNAEAGLARHPEAPALPSMSAVVADAYLHVRDALFDETKESLIDKEELVRRCLLECATAPEGDWMDALRILEEFVADDPSLAESFRSELSLVDRSSMLKPDRLPTYGTSFLRLDGSEFGVRNVFDAAQLCERLLGYKRDGVNAHLVQEEPTVVWPPTPKAHSTVERRGRPKLEWWMRRLMSHNRVR